MQSKNVRLATLKRRLRRLESEPERLQKLDYPPAVRDKAVELLRRATEDIEAEIQRLLDEDSPQEGSETAN